MRWFELNEEKLEFIIISGIFLPYVKDVLIKKNADGTYDQALALVHQDLRNMKETFFKENISIEKIHSKQRLFQEYQISHNGRTFNKSFFKPHMNNVIKSMIRDYVS
jgi:hypothetical protein